MKKADSKYTLVVEAAKRARQICDGAQKTTYTDSDKPVTIATCEIAEGKIKYERKKSGIK
ncbi:MAG: DNA-directed RNA polymerase subunit omega [Opitutales bacterium]|nr:DNA-directed RNA polymerase subunit omega [Opitutales bacterium]